MKVRKVVTRSSGHTRGLMPSIKNLCSAAWDSGNEKRFYQLLELSWLVRSFIVQPTCEYIVVSGRQTTYTPDVEIFFNSGDRCIVEVKPELRTRTAAVRAKLLGIEDHYRQSNQRFCLVKDDWLEMEPRVSNLELLMYHRRHILLNQMERRRLAQLVTSHQPKTVSELIDLAGHEKAWLLLGLAIVGVDIELPLNQNTKLYLDGGHRHASFLA